MQQSKRLPLGGGRAIFVSHRHTFGTDALLLLISPRQRFPTGFVTWVPAVGSFLALAAGSSGRYSYRRGGHPGRCLRASGPQPVRKRLGESGAPGL